VETSKDADMPCEPLTLIAQGSEFPHLELAQRRPPTKENGHTFIAIVPRILKLARAQE
jgi:hypothetical protein